MPADVLCLHRSQITENKVSMSGQILVFKKSLNESAVDFRPVSDEMKL